MTPDFKKNLLERGSKAPGHDLNAISMFFNLVLKTIVAPLLVYAGWHLTNNKDVLLYNIGWGMIVYSLISLWWAYLTSLEAVSCVAIPTCILMGVLLLWLGEDDVFWGGIAYFVIACLLIILFFIFG